MDENDHLPIVQPLTNEDLEASTPLPRFPISTSPPEDQPAENLGEALPTDVAEQVVELVNRMNAPNLQEKKADMLLAGLECYPETETLRHTLDDLGRGKLVFEARHDRDAGKTVLKKSVLSAAQTGMVAEVVTSDDDGTSTGKISHVSVNPDGFMALSNEQAWDNLDHLDLTIDQIMVDLERLISYFEGGGTSAMYLMSRVLDSK